MKISLRIVSFIFLLFTSICGYGQHAYEQKGRENTVAVRNIEFMVRNGDYIKDIATKIKVPARDILKLNKIRSKHFLAYPGLKLTIPVQVQSKVWDPTKEDMTGYSPSREDRSESENDYELIIDSTNYRLEEDFIDLSAAHYDSIEYSNIGTHVQRIERRIKYLYHKLDSVKQTDFKFDYEDQDKNSILGKMKLTRDKYYSEGPIGKQIDSLKEEKTYLGQRLIVLRNQIAEYEYLADNASYSSAHFKEDERKKPANWGDHLAYESLYMKNKAATEAKTNTTTHDTAQKVAAQPVSHVLPTTPKTDTLPSVAAIAKTEPVTPKPVNTDIESGTPKVVQPSQPAPPPVSQVVSTTPKIDTVPPATTIAKPEPVTPKPVNTDIESSTPKVTGPSHPAPPPVPGDETASAPKIVTPPAPTSSPTPQSVAPTPEPVKPSVKVVESDTPTHIDTVDDEESIPRYKSDFSILHKRMYSVEIKSSNPPQRSLAMLSAAQLAIKLPPLSASAIPKETPKPQGPAAISKPENLTPTNNIAKVVPQNIPAPQTPPVASTPPAQTAPVSTPKKQTSSIDTASLQPHKKIAPDATPVNPPTTVSTPKKQTSNIDTSSPQLKKAIAADVTPVNVAQPRPIVSDTPVQKHIAQTIDAAPAIPTTSISTSEQPVMTLESKIDTAIERPKPAVNTDPLASYKTDSDFVTKGIQVKDIPVEQVKNKPKYLIPVDSVSRIKGDFYLIRARQVLEKGDFKTGDKYLRKSLDLDPTNPQAWMLHADLFLTLGLADQALKEYEISGEIDSTNPKVFYNIALLYVKANNHQKAYKYFSKSIEVSDKYLLAYMGRASLLMDDRDYAGAIQDYDRLLAVNKYYSPAFKQRGLAKMELGKFADAILDFNQYLEIEDPDGYVIFQRGISKIYSNNLLQGCLDLSSAQELGFKDAEKAIKKFCE